MHVGQYSYRGNCTTPSEYHAHVLLIRIGPVHVGHYVAAMPAVPLSMHMCLSTPSVSMSVPGETLSDTAHYAPIQYIIVDPKVEFLLKKIT